MIPRSEWDSASNRPPSGLSPAAIDSEDGEAAFWLTAPSRFTFPCSGAAGRRGGGTEEGDEDNAPLAGDFAL